MVPIAGFSLLELYRFIFIFMFYVVCLIRVPDIADDTVAGSAQGSTDEVPNFQFSAGVLNNYSHLTSSTAGNIFLPNLFSPPDGRILDISRRIRDIQGR
jgi:hypothetical protein